MLWQWVPANDVWKANEVDVVGVDGSTVLLGEGSDEGVSGEIPSRSGRLEQVEEKLQRSALSGEDSDVSEVEPAFRRPSSLEHAHGICAQGAMRESLS